MPEKSGKLTDEEQQLAKAWVKEHWKNWACPFSGDTDWDLGEYLSESRAFSGGGLNVGGGCLPISRSDLPGLWLYGIHQRYEGWDIPTEGGQPWYKKVLLAHKEHSKQGSPSHTLAPRSL